MKLTISAFICLMVLNACGQNNGSAVKIPVAESTSPAKNEAVAVFAEGCFWHSEIIFQSLEGVRDAVSGYAGGKETGPDYESVSTGGSGHAESVKVFYDPSKISYATLVAAFFASHDPTQVNRQGNDVGPQYRSVAFYSNEKERQQIAAEIQRLSASGKYAGKIATQVLPLTKFYPAEPYHQEYIANHPSTPYVRSVSIPDYLHFRKSFNGPFKD